MKKAFTLLELIIVLAIIATITAIPLLKVSIIDDLAADIEVEAFVNNYNLARQKAMSTGGRYYLLLRKDFYYMGESYTSDVSKDDPQSVTFKHVNYLYRDNTIEFREDGYVRPKDGGSFELAFKNKQSKKIRKFTISALTGYLDEK